MARLGSRIQPSRKAWCVLAAYHDMSRSGLIADNVLLTKKQKLLYQQFLSDTQQYHKRTSISDNTRTIHHFLGEKGANITFEQISDLEDAVNNIMSLRKKGSKNTQWYILGCFEAIKMFERRMPEVCRNADWNRYKRRFLSDATRNHPQRSFTLGPNTIQHIICTLKDN